MKKELASSPEQETIDAAARPTWDMRPDTTDNNTDKLTIYTGGLLILACLTVCYVAAEVILPICVALILNLVLRPVIRALVKWRIPQSLAAIIVIISFVGGLIAVGTILSPPASVWSQNLPNELPKLRERFQFLIKPVANIQKTVSDAETATMGTGKTVSVAVRGAGLSDKLFTSTRILISETFEMLLVLFFLLLSGETFLQRFVEILPRVQDKRKALQISKQIETDISAYLRTITFMNLCVGICTTLIMYVCGVEDAALWGAIAFFLNFVPILGPLTAVCIFILSGIAANENLAQALLPAALYFGVHIVEGEVVTPLILSKRFTLNPALVILALIFWYWMWGVAGAILATPMLAIFKIICDRVTRLQSIGHLIEG